MTRAKDRDGIQKIGSQHYRVVVDLPPDPSTGKRRRKSKAVHGPLSAAKDARRAMLGLRDTGRLVGTSDQTLGVYLRSWLENKRGNVADSTWQRYDSLMRSAIIPALGGVKLRDLSVQHLRDYFATCRTEPSPRSKGPDKAHPDRTQGRISPTTIHHRWVVLKAALAQAVDDGLIPAEALYERSGAPKFKAPRGKRQHPEVIDTEDVATLLESADGQFRVILELAFATGARLGELLALRWRDVDFRKRTLHISRSLIEPMRATPDARWYSFKVPKSGVDRLLAVDDETLHLLKAHRTEQTESRLAMPTEQPWCDLDLIFPNMWQLKGVCAGEPTRPSTVSRQFRALADDAKLEGVRFHDLRHAHASVLLAQGASMNVVQERLGHADVATTLRNYGHLLKGQERAAVDGLAEALATAKRKRAATL